MLPDYHLVILITANFPTDEMKSLMYPSNPIKSQ